MLLSMFSYLGQRCLDYLQWYDEQESLWKLVLIPTCIIAYAIMIIADAFDMIWERLED